MFEFTRDYYPKIKYVDKPRDAKPQGRCYAFDNPFILYPALTAFDPMMPFYIHTIHKGLAVFAQKNRLYVNSPPLQSRRQYCSDTRLIAETFVEYFERFQSDSETCWKLKEITLECYTFRQMRQFWAQDAYDKLCLDEDGCFNIMDLYGDDPPYCVKYIASEQFKNASFGSWHHSFINFCELTDIVPEVKYANYDRLIVKESGKTEEQLKLMCEYLRFQVFAEEGKEGEIQQVETGKEERSSCARFYWHLLVAVLITSCLC